MHLGLLLTNCMITSSEAVGYLQFYQKLHLLNGKMLFCYPKSILPFSKCNFLLLINAHELEYGIGIH